jgi:hypothetical protein
MKSTKSVNPHGAAVTGALLAVPFIITNLIVSLRIEPFYALLETIPAVRNSPVFPLLLLFLFPVGAFIAMRPMIQKETQGQRTFYPVNILIAVILLVTFFILFSALGNELYRCEVLKIPNCD